MPPLIGGRGTAGAVHAGGRVRESGVWMLPAGSRGSAVRGSPGTGPGAWFRSDLRARRAGPGCGPEQERGGREGVPRVGGSDRTPIVHRADRCGPGSAGRGHADGRPEAPRRPVPVGDRPRRALGTTGHAGTTSPGRAARSCRAPRGTGPAAVQETGPEERVGRPGAARAGETGHGDAPPAPPHARKELRFGRVRASVPESLSPRGVGWRWRNGGIGGGRMRVSGRSAGNAPAAVDTMIRAPGPATPSCGFTEGDPRRRGRPPVDARFRAASRSLEGRFDAVRRAAFRYRARGGGGAVRPRRADGARGTSVVPTVRS